MFEPADLTVLVEEYNTKSAEGESVDWSEIRDRLQRKHGWTPEGADHVVSLVRQYGAFVLRNAAALAIALDVEDGDKGL